MNDRQAESYQNYAREKLWQALGCLIGEGPLRNRLKWANDFVMRLMDVHFPSEMLSKFHELQSLLQRNAIALANASSATPLADNEAKEAAETILSLYVALKGGITAAPAAGRFG